MTINILFTSAGRRVELIRAFKNAYEVLGITGNIVATDIDSLAPTLHIVDKPYVVPRFDTPDYVPALLEICKREEVSLIFPLIDPDIPILAKNREAFENIGAYPVVIDLNKVITCGDKWLTYQFFRDESILTPQSWLPDQIDLAKLEFPLFIKPRQGSGSKDAYKVNNEKELTFFLDYVEKPIIQEFISGTEVTNDVFCGLEGNLIEVVLRQRLETRGGEVSKGITIKNPDIIHNCIKIAESLSAVGSICVQCIVRDGQPFFTEVNARFGGGAPLSFAAGADLPLWLLAQSANSPITLPALGSYQTGLHLTRFDDAIFLSEKDREQMASNRL